MFRLFLMTTLLCTSAVQAKVFHWNVSQVKGTIEIEKDLDLIRAQGQLICDMHYRLDPGTLIRRKNIESVMDATLASAYSVGPSVQAYQISVPSVTLSNYNPTWYPLSCSYNLYLTVFNKLTGKEFTSYLRLARAIGGVAPRDTIRTELNNRHLGNEISDKLLNPLSLFLEQGRRGPYFSTDKQL